MSGVDVRGLIAAAQGLGLFIGPGTQDSSRHGA
jgi:hypothetical protein